MIRTGRLARILAPAAVLALASVAAPAQGDQSPSTGGDVRVIQTAAAAFGEVRGRVTDAEGAPARRSDGVGPRPGACRLRRL